MDPRKLKVLEEILSHLDASQANALKDLLDESKKPAEMGDDAAIDDEATDPQGMDATIGGDQGKEMGSAPQPTESDQEMSDDELKDLIGQYLK